MTSRPSYCQLEALVDFLEQNPSVAKGLLRTLQAKLETKEKWASLATRLNALGGAIKDGQGWAKYWAEKKWALKKQCAQTSASMRRTGGGAADSLPALSALDKRLVAVMGGLDFAAGDQNLRVNPFPELVSAAQDTRSFSPAVESSVISEDSDMQHSMQSVTEDPGPSRIPRTTVTMSASSTPLPSNIPRPRRRVVRTINSDMERFSNIEARRVEAEMTAAQAVAKIAEALLSVGDALKEIARKMPEP
ncbi:unnamed protein product [Arctia plantaginis]|uniref:Regulatory protein zeste n=1 Tax=Arctia plantaginis TaxID=874455 RepID=A0A8S1A2L9_ARCPL|nr:unnamed protein product [Arctia plantaginis]